MEEFYAIGKKVKAARKSLGLTQKELAEKTGYTESGISRVEKGEIDLPVSKIKVLATTLSPRPRKPLVSVVFFFFRARLGQTSK